MTRRVPVKNKENRVGRLTQRYGCSQRVHAVFPQFRLDVYFRLASHIPGD
jgi:hypothetical protein